MGLFRGHRRNGGGQGSEQGGQGSEQGQGAPPRCAGSCTTRPCVVPRYATWTSASSFAPRCLDRRPAQTGPREVRNHQSAQEPAPYPPGGRGLAGRERERERVRWSGWIVTGLGATVAAGQARSSRRMTGGRGRTRGTGRSEWCGRLGRPMSVGWHPTRASGGKRRGEHAREPRAAIENGSGLRCTGTDLRTGVGDRLRRADPRGAERGGSPWGRGQRQWRLTRPHGAGARAPGDPPGAASAWATRTPTRGRAPGSAGRPRAPSGGCLQQSRAWASEHNERSGRREGGGIPGPDGAGAAGREVRGRGPALRLRDGGERRLTGLPDD